MGYSETLTGLAPGTTYYYCAIAQNAVGTAFGTVRSFTTAATPTVVSQAAATVTSTGATLQGAANPNLSDTTGYFRYATANPGACDDAFGLRAPGSGGAALGAGSNPVDYSEAIAGLAPGTTYYYCAIAQNASGTGFGAVLSFTTPAAPTAVTQTATNVTSTGATFQGSGNPNLDDAIGYFRYAIADPGSCDDAFGTRAPTSGGAALGTGASPVAFSEAATGLAPGTTYYFCAIAQNASGTGFGAVLSFTTPAAPTMTTQTPTAVSGTGAMLQGSANPNQSDTTGYFRYGTTDPGNCTDAFGTRAPASGGASLGAGQSAVVYSQAITGLAPGTTYYVCAAAQNAWGTSFGAVLSFTTPAAPTVTTLAPTAVTHLGATLQGSADPNLSATTAYFRYAAADPGTCDDTFGIRAPASGGASLGAGQSPVDYAEAIVGLAPGTTYYVCAIAQNAEGTSFGAVLSFTTAAAPDVTTEDAADVTSSTATLNGTVNPNLLASTGWFRYDTTDPGSCNDSFGTRAPASGGTAFAAQSGAQAYSEALTGLLPGRTYYFCAIAQNAAGTSFGEVRTVTTTAEIPSVTTNPPTSVEPTSAQLNGAANPNGDAATGWFRLDTTDPGACNDSFGTRVPATGGSALGGGIAQVAFSEQATTLTAGTRYYVCAIASNAIGTGYGEVLTFVAGGLPPVVTTEAAMDILATSATMAGTANPNGTYTTAWFRFGDSDPGTCSDSFGARVPGTNGVAVGNGFTSVDFSQPLLDLEPATTYFYCAAASNDVGATFGEVRAFTTAAIPPEVETLSATPLEGIVSMTGAANPMGSITSGWFRFDAVNPGACDDTFGTRMPAAGGTILGAGRDAVAYTSFTAELAPGTYYFCAIASNGGGTGYGELKTFEVPVPPVDPGGKKGGCGCRVSSRQSGSAVVLISLLVLFLLRRRRRAIRRGRGKTCASRDDFSK